MPKCFLLTLSIAFACLTAVGQTVFTTKLFTDKDNHKTKYIQVLIKSGTDTIQCADLSCTLRDTVLFTTQKSIPADYEVVFRFRGDSAQWQEVNYPFSADGKE